MSELSPKQQVWLEAYLQCWNATEAAREAGYKNPRISGSENLTKPYIRAEIEKRLKQHALSADEVLLRLAEQATGDMLDFFDLGDDGSLKLNLRKAQAKGKTHLIKKMHFKDGGLQRIELHNAQNALVQLGRHHALFTDKISVDWQQALVQAGLDPGDEFERLVQYLASRLEPSGDGGDAE